MKKLLSLLGAVAITASSASIVVSCSYAPSISKSVDRETDFYSQISAEALKPAILADQNFNINGQENSHIDMSFTNNYYGSKTVSQTFGNLFDPQQGARPDQTSQVSSLYQSVFGSTQGGYNYSALDNSASSLNGHVKAGTNLDKILKARNNGESIDDVSGDKKFNLQQPSTSVSSTLNLISGLANIVFKNDFDPSIGETLISVLTSSTVKNALAGDSIKGIFGTINDILSSNNTAISNLLSNITQSDLAKASAGKTYSDVLTSQTQTLFGSLIYFISGNKFMYNSDTTKNKDDGLTAFVKFLQASSSEDDIKKLVNAGDLISAPEAKSDKDYSNMINSVAGIASFAITLLHYFRAFDSQFNKLVSPIDGNHLFSDELTNGEAINKVLQTDYVNTADGDDFWYVVKPEAKAKSIKTVLDDENNKPTNQYYTKLNLQNLISDLQYYLSPADSTGHQTLRLFTELLAGPSGQLNPIFQAVFNAFSAYKPALQKMISDLLGKIPLAGSFLQGYAGQIADLIFKYGKNGLIDIIDWFTSDGDDPTAGSVKDIIKAITDIFPGNISQFGDAKTKEILEIIDGVINYLKGSDGDAFYAHPWSTIYGGGILNSVGQIMRSVAGDAPADQADDVYRVGYALEQLRDIRTMLVMNFKSLVRNIGILVGNTSLAVPDWLYLGNTKSVANIVDYLANQQFIYTQDPGSGHEIIHNSNEYNSLSENRFFSFNTLAIQNLVESLLPSQDLTDTTKTRVVFESTADDASTAEAVSPIKALYDVIMNYGATSAPNIGGSYYVYLAGDTYTKDTNAGGREIISTSNFYDPSVVSMDPKAKTTDNQTFTIGVKGLPDLVDAKKNVSISSLPTGINVDSASISKNILTVKLNKPISQTNKEQDFTINYSDGINNISSELVVVAKNATPDNTPSADDSKVYVSAQALEYLLGVDDTEPDSVTRFRPGSLLMSVSNLYGHWYTGNGMKQTPTSDLEPLGGGQAGDKVNPYTEGAESIFGLLATVAQFTSNSITTLTKEVYGRYLDPKNWRIANVRQHGLDIESANADTIQQLDYDLRFYNADAQRTFVYHVTLQRQAVNDNSIDNTSDTGWVVTDLMLQN